MMRWFVVVGVLVVASQPVGAKPEPGPAPIASDEPVAEAEGDGDEEFEIPHRVGPATIALGEGVEIDLPAGFVLYERAETVRMLEAEGDSTDGALAIIEPADGGPWSVFLGIADVGYVFDADAAQLDGAGLLQSMREGTAEQNQVRIAKGTPELFIDGWSEEPRYDATQRALRWGVLGHSTIGPVINQFTNVLGRRGYVSVNLIAAPDALEAAKVEAAPVIAAVHFQSGHRYQDYQPGVDRDSGMSLRNLIVGGSVAAAVGSKAGLFAKLALVLKKLGLVIAAAIAGIGKWITGRRAARRES